MSEVKVYGITQTDTPPRHDSQYMCDYKMVQLRSPCMDLDWPKQNDFHVVLKSDYDALKKTSAFFDNQYYKLKSDYDSAQKKIEAQGQIIEKLKENFSDLVRDCKWYADNGSEQERHHFLTVEAQGNYLDLAEAILAKGKADE